MYRVRLLNPTSVGMLCFNCRESGRWRACCRQGWLPMGSAITSSPYLATLLRSTQILQLVSRYSEWFNGCQFSASGLRTSSLQFPTLYPCLVLHDHNTTWRRRRREVCGTEKW